MKIESGTNLTRTQLETIRPTEQAKATTPPPPAVTEDNKDKAEFSEKSLMLSKARGVLEALPQTRADRVNALRDQVQTNTYQVPYDKLAGRLLNKLI